MTRHSAAAKPDVLHRQRGTTTGAVAIGAASAIPSHVGSISDKSIRTRVRKLLQSLAPGGAAIDRRHDQRYPFPKPICLTPVAHDGQTPLGQSRTVVGSSLSERGLGFFHSDTLPHKRMVATLESSDGEPISLLIELTWCRFIGNGWYESGGRFVQSLVNG